VEFPDGNGVLALTSQIPVVDATRTWSTLQTYPDTWFKIVSDGDATKNVIFDPDPMTSGKQAVLQFNNVADATYAFPSATQTLVGRTSTETLTNKTLTTPTIASFTPTTSTTLANVTGLSLSVSASTYYAFEFFVLWESDNTANGISFAVTCPSSPTLFTYAAEIGNRTGAAASSAGLFTGGSDASGVAVTCGAVLTVNRINVARVYGILVNGANSGSLQLQYAGEDGANNSKVRQGSYGRLITLP
jgi:hypothetical protein